ncbi:hypothetical protein [Flavobacterium degerlachei]|jgi:hypothetical protein|uniref:Uncharacterized protein n=1 Tax=Flavobacterium degerlachei TaxID=229203 RepID=A0A1H3BWA0_9FLAO|nr:hypothetical protein [Flavobacterium degerlachei]SDX46217.1 hypothetical protein SAMN05444338_110138 [Flavobacterium degerlachei]
MSNIHAIIASLSNDNKKEFVRNLRERNKRNDTKNVELFRLLDNANMPSDIDVILYGKPSKGAYHALSKRLHDLLIDFVATKGFDKESSEEMNALKLLLASRIFFQQKQPFIAFKTLAKAEIIAGKHSLFNILNEIYQTLLLHAHLNTTLDLQNVIDKYQTNKLNIGLEENLNLFYATIQAELSHGNPGISDTINRNLVKFNISITKSLSYQSLFKILQITNQVAYVTRDYQAILPFIEDACKKIEATERTKDKHLYDHLQVLYYLANTYFRIKNFELSAAYLDTMHSNMSLENKKYSSVFYPQYVLLKNLVLIFKGQNDEAVREITLFDFEKYKNKTDYTLDLKLTLVVALFFKNNYKEALKTLQGFYHSNYWYIEKMGYIWVIQKNLIEILLLIELDYMDLAESRLSSFRRKYTAHIQAHNGSVVLDFFKLITIFYYKTEDIYSENFRKKADNLLNINSKDTDVFTISFYAWIRAKIDKADFYATCLSHIKMLSHMSGVNKITE